MFWDIHLGIWWKRGLDVPHKKDIGCRNCQVPFKLLQDWLLHHQHLITRIGIIWYEHKVVNLQLRFSWLESDCVCEYLIKLLRQLRTKCERRTWGAQISSYLDAKNIALIPTNWSSFLRTAFTERNRSTILMVRYRVSGISSNLRWTSISQSRRIILILAFISGWVSM